MTEESNLLKRDVLGRITVTPEHREQLLNAFEASSLSGARFAKTHGIHVQTFASWIQKRRRARGDYQNKETRQRLRAGKHPQNELTKTLKNKSSGQSTPLQLIEVNLSAPARESQPSSAETEPLEVVLPNGATVKITHESQLPLLKSLLADLLC